MTELALGMDAPDFTLPTDDGEPVHLGSLKGKAVVVFFYPKDNTPGCTREAISFSQLKSAFDAANVELIGISPDTIKKHENFRKKHALTVHLGADVEKQVVEAYGVWIEKSLFSRKYMGVDRSTFLIDANGKIAKIWRKVKVAGHVEAVLEAARAL